MLQVETRYILKKLSKSAAIFAIIISLFSASYANDSIVKEVQEQSLEKTINKKKKLINFTSGTGFFINKNYIITNEHVVLGCKQIRIRGEVEPGYASLVSIDKESDLALLTSENNAKRIASLRKSELVNLDENVTVMGYPLEHGINGKYLVKKGKVTDIDEVINGVQRLQFTDSVEKGNSGGPLLDKSGNVVGVVVGRMNYYLADAETGELKSEEPVKVSSVAVTLPSLKDFLENNGVDYATSEYDFEVNDKTVENAAKDYVVNIHCVK